MRYCPEAKNNYVPLSGVPRTLGEERLAASIRMERWISRTQKWLNNLNGLFWGLSFLFYLWPLLIFLAKKSLQ